MKFSIPGRAEVMNIVETKNQDSYMLNKVKVFAILQEVLLELQGLEVCACAFKFHSIKAAA